jgi:hypothetical protein
MTLGSTRVLVSSFLGACGRAPFDTELCDHLSKESQESEGCFMGPGTTLSRLCFFRVQSSRKQLKTSYFFCQKVQTIE